MSDFLFSIPTWIVVAAVCVTCIGVFGAFILAGAADLGDKHWDSARADRADQRMRDLNHADVADRVDTRDFQSWDADEDLRDPGPPIPIVKVWGGGWWRR